MQDNYSTEDFIAALSDKLIAESKAEPGRECKCRRGWRVSGTTSRFLPVHTR